MRSALVGIESAIRRILSNRFLRGPFFSLGSQVVGLAQLALLLFRAGANEATDAYFYLFNIGMLPIQIVLVGVMYPLLLNQERFTQTALLRIRLLTPFLSIVLMAAGAWWLQSSGRLGTELVPLALASTVNAFVQARLWYRAVTAEAGGDPRWIAGVALPANVLGALALLVPWGSPTVAVTAMVSALIIGNTALLIYAAFKRVGDHVFNDAPRLKLRNSADTGMYWFLSKSAVAYVGLTVLQSLAILLPPSSLTILNVAVKLVGSISATLVNAVMPVLVHQNSDSQDGSRRFLRFLILAVTGGAVLLVAGVGAIESTWVVPAICVSLWALASSVSSVSQRVAFRFLPPNASRITLVVVPAVVALALLSTLAPGFQIVVLLCAYGSLDSFTAAVLLLSLRDRTAAGTMLAACAGFMTIWALALL